MHGQHCIKTWSSNQSVIALSSGEAEFYAMVKGSSELLGMISLAQDLKVHWKVACIVTRRLRLVFRSDADWVR